MHLLKNPSLFVPPMLFPLMSFMAFAGGLSALRKVPGFDYPGGYTSFQFVFVLLQSAAFGGVFTGFSDRAGLRARLRAAAADRGAAPGRPGRGVRARCADALEHRRRAADRRRARRGDAGGRQRHRRLRALRASPRCSTCAGMLWACGIAMRIRSVQAGPLMQTPVFMLLFLVAGLRAARPARGLDPRRGVR